VASPASQSSLSTVLIETSTTRLIDRIDEPSHNILHSSKDIYSSSSSSIRGAFRLAGL
jgi:hypothetical protein